MKRYVGIAFAILLTFAVGFALTEIGLKDSFAQEDSGISNDDANRDLAIVAINKYNADRIGTGTVYIFDETYSLIKILESPEKPQSGQFNGDITYAEDVLILSTSSRTSSDYDDLQPGAPPQEGAVSLFDDTTGSFIQTIRNPEPNTLKDYVEGRFGSSVVYTDGKIIIGDSHRDVNGLRSAGIVYVYDKDTGDLLSTIDNPNPTKDDNFGMSLTSLDENTIAVGIPGKTVDRQEYAGAVLIFDVNSGSMTKTVKAPDPGPRDKFGHSIDALNGKLVVGAPGTVIDDEMQVGQVYVYNTRTWELLYTLEHPDPDSNDLFGMPVMFAEESDSGEGDKIAVSAINDGFADEGAVYVFDAESGRHLDTIKSPQKIKGGFSGNQFGTSLSVAGERLAIGDPNRFFGDKKENARTGGAYVYDITTGELLYTIENPVSDSSDAFGYHLGFVGDMVSSISSISSQDVNTAIAEDVALTTPQNISNTSNDSHGSHVAVDGKNIYVIWAEQTSAGGATEILFSKSADSGENFGTPKKISGDSETLSVTSVAVDGKNIFIMWMDRFEDKVSEILFSKSADGGETFSEPQRISDKSSFASDSQIAGNDENIFVTWIEGSFREWDIFFSKSTDSGETFSEPQNISNSIVSADQPYIITDGNNIFVAWSDSSSDTDRIFFSKSADGGETFSAPLDISGGFEYSDSPSIATDGKNIFVIWNYHTVGNDPDILFSKSADGGETFSEPKNISNSREYSSSSHIETVGNNIFVIWSDSDSKNGNVFLSKSTDSGETFSEPQNISNNDKGFADGNSMTTDGEEVFVTWTWRFVTGSTPYEIFFTKSLSELQQTISNDSGSMLENNDDGNDSSEIINSINWIDELGADYAIGGFGAIKLVHPGLNANLQLIDIPLVRVWSDTDPQGIQVEAIETGADTGVFYADVNFSDKESSHLQIHVSDGDRVIVSFEDDDVHLEDTIQIATKDSLDFYPKTTGDLDRKADGTINLTEIESEAIPTTTPSGIKILEYGMFDAEDNGDLIHQLYVGKKYWFEFEYQNELEASYDIRAFAQLIDKNKTESNVLQKIEGFSTLEPSDGFAHGFVWTPEYTGQFKITAEVISLDDLHVGVIAPQYDLVVIDRPTLKQQITNTIPTDDILCSNSNNLLAERTNKELACVDFDTAKRLGWKLVHFEEIILDPDTKESLLKKYRDLPEVAAFYEKYEDVQSSVREDHISYFAGNDDNYKIRMNLHLDENLEINDMELHCYYQRIHQYEIPSEDIVSKLEKIDCR